MMRNKKNILAALLALAMALPVTACANTSGTAPAGHTETAIVVNHGAKPSVNHISENTVTKKGGASLDYSLMPYSYNYRNSKSHYEAMVSERFVSYGVSHMYCNASEGWVVQFDTFLKEQPVPLLGQ